MENQKYPFYNVSLPYGYAGLEPYIDAKTMMLHHDRHLQTYIDNLNKYLETRPDLQNLGLGELNAKYSFDEEIRHNAGGVWNHFFFFDSLRPGISQIVIGLSGRFLQMVGRDFGGMEAFKEKFTNAALGVFGSGYAWLCVDPNGRFIIATLPNQDTPLPLGVRPILGIDVWEHAYYLKHYNVGADYIKDFWHVVDWVKVSARLEDCFKK
jgi:Fe-Mn family superoxide dismutase